MNAGLAVAMLRHQERLDIPESALRAAMGWTEWPARLQLLGARAGARPAAGRRPSCGWTAPTIRPRRARWRTISAAMSPPAGPSIWSSACSPTRTRRACSTAFAAARRSSTPSRCRAMRIIRPRRSPRWRARRGSTPCPPPGSPTRCAGSPAMPTRARPPIVLVMGSLYLAGEVLAANLQPPA